MSTRTSPSAAAQRAAKSPATPPPTTTRSKAPSRVPYVSGSLMVVFASESITSWLSLPPHPHSRARRARRGVPGPRRRARRAPLGARTRAVPGHGRFPAERSAPTRRSSSRSSATSRRRSTCARSRTSSSSAPGAIRRVIRSAGSWRPRTSGSFRSGSIRASRGHALAPVDALPATAFDHGAIVLAGRERLRGKLSYSNIGFALAPDDLHARRAPRRLRGRARLRGLRDEPQARAVRRGAIEPVGRGAGTRACGRSTCRAVPLPRAPARGDGPVRRAAPAALRRDRLEER